jgi:signal transduction histidine kinase
VLLPVGSAVVLTAFAVSRADAGLELAALLLGAAALAAGHLLMRARRERQDSARETASLRQELELRARVAECEARRARLTAFSELAAQIAHEVRNPLASIVLNTELLEEELGACAAPSGHEVRALVSSIKAEAARLHTLTDEYLTFARLPRADPAPAAINALVEETARFTREEIARHGIDLRLRLASHLPDALIDQKGVRQVVLNLLRNAIEATPSGGRIDIVTGMADGAVRVEVRDTGRGISPEVRDTVFDPFFSTKSKGTGLGLAVARRIVTDHGGSLLVADSDRGARLVFTLPLAGAAPAAPDGAAAPALAGAGS